MSRTVSAVVTWGDTYLGRIGPFPVSVPWWADVEPVVAHLREVLGVPVLVLRLLEVEGGEGARDGHVTYHMAALDRPAPGLLAERPVNHAVLNGPEELRLPHPGNWRSGGGPPAVVDWADAYLGNPVIDGLRARDFLPAAKRPPAARADGREAKLIGGQQADDHRNIAGPGAPEDDTIRTQVERFQDLHLPSLPASRSGRKPGTAGPVAVGCSWLVRAGGGGWSVRADSRLSAIRRWSGWLAWPVTVAPKSG